jgi:photosystem II stability/assembly factor-like uncharacterized protein
MIKKLKYKWLIPFLPLVILVFLYIQDHSENISFKSESWENESEEEQEREREGEKEGFDKPNGYYDFYRHITTPIGQQKSGYTTNYTYFEYQKAQRKIRSLKASMSRYVWVQRGPGNVGGRTRTIIVDPDDPTNQTWIAASVSGGIWRTTNGGVSWVNLTENIPNLATNTMTMGPTDHNTIYAGTGEGYGGVGMVGGNGIFVTHNKGTTWEMLSSTMKGDNFRFVNKIIVDPVNADILIVATNRGIFKSADAGANWDTVYYTGYAVQDLVANPKKPSTIYAGVNGLGIIKSYNNGSTWNNAYEGIGTGGRFSLAISPVDTNYIYTSVEAPLYVTDLYISVNSGGSWNKMNNFDNTFINFQGVQGWFNNVIASHPFDSKKIFIGGVYLGSVEFKSSTSESTDQVIRVDTLGTGSFMGFVGFGGSFLGGGMSTGLEEDADVTVDDYTSVELRFGPGISQKACRFTVPAGEGAGVPPDDYTYHNYVDVPFQAWDTKNNIQLMVSFRDQEADGNFNLVERDIDDDIKGREYIFVHAVPYSSIPDPNIAVAGGHYYKMLYFFWPELPKDKTWNQDKLPISKITVKYGKFSLQNATTTVLADKTRNVGLHVDHHDLKTIITDQANKKFTILNANDGGLGISEDGGSTWRQIKKGYITTQFYGVAKKTGAQVYIGGMQDNGTWLSPGNETASSVTDYTFELEGDGFEALWHPLYPERIIASSYNNRIKVTTDGGETWNDATKGINGDGPFVTRLSNSPQNPNLVFAVGNKGVYRHTNFCIGRFGWQLIEINDGWTILNTVTNSHNVKVSLADPNIVWAGGGMHGDPDLHLFLSKDKGQTFDSVSNYTLRDMDFLTALATNPVEPATAYAMFSVDHKPKILRTVDYGKNWEDISGFGADSSSKNGFPDVSVYSLLVMPSNPDIIWAGTEIGIIETTDRGVSWHLADNGLPAVSVWQMFIQDNEIIVATHGRGIWSTNLSSVSIIDPGSNPESGFETYPNPSDGNITINFSNEEYGALGIHVYDLSGKEVYTLNAQKDEYDYSRELNLESLPSGSYVIALEFEKKMYNSKIIIR